jgi:hypothetical protein
VRLTHIVWSLAIVVPAQAQVPSVSITGRTGTLGDGFSNVVGIQELKDGRVVVADGKDRLIRIGDFQRQTVTQLGRNGNGPREYTLVAGLFRTAGDTIRMFDFPGRRLLSITPEGEISGTTVIDVAQAPLPDEKHEGSRLIGGPRYIDHQGRLYSQIDYVQSGAGVLVDASYIAVTNPATRTFRRAAPFQPWYPAKSTRWRAPFMYGDVWTAASDGRIARVVPTDFHVEWYRDGELLARGPAYPVSPIKVTKADRDAWYAARAARGPAGAGVSGGPPAPVGASTPEPTRSSFKPFTDEDFPAEKPPFIEEFVGRAAMVAPNGELWVSRVVADGATPQVDVFDAKGVLVRNVSLPRSTRLGGFGKTAVYLVRTDDDGLQWVERYSPNR